MADNTFIDQRAVQAAVRDLRTTVDLIRWGASRLNAAGGYSGHGHADAVDECLALALHVLNLPHGVPDLLLGARLTRDERLAIAALIARRVNERVPTAYLTGEGWFAGLRFLADHRALVPRSPFGELVERRFEPYLDAAGVRRVADLGTGGGCIAVAIAHALPDATVDAVDCCPQALSLARENVALHGLEERVHLHLGDLYAPLAGQRYDLIVSNPPYVPDVDVDNAPVEFSHEPRAALAAGDDGLEVVRRIVAGAREHLTDHGVLMVEVGASWVAVEEQFPDLALTWVDLERGGDGIFAVEADALDLMGA